MKEARQGPGFHLLTHSAHLVEDRLRDLLKPLGIHAGQARVIHALSRMKEASQRQLALEFNVTPASMSQMTKRLINNGFIELRSDPHDKRVGILSLTSKGEQLLEEVFLVWREVDQIIVDAIGAESAEQLFSHTWSLRNALGGKAPGTKGAPPGKSNSGKTG